MRVERGPPPFGNADTNESGLNAVRLQERMRGPPFGNADTNESG